MSAKIISLFNHKGGVSKTTTTFHLGCMMTKLGKKVLLVDTDSQCNLTGLILNKNDKPNFLEEFYENREGHNIYHSLAKAFDPESEFDDKSEEGVKATETNIENLSLLAGNVRFSEFDIQIANALLTYKSIPTSKPPIVAINNLIRNTASKNNCNIVLVDMSPSFSATNKIVLMSSDYFIVPVFPDFFCLQSIKSLSDVLPQWLKDTKELKERNHINKTYLGTQTPKMLGITMNNYRVYDTNNHNSQEDLFGEITNKDEEKMSKSFKEWSDKIKKSVTDELVPALEQAKLGDHNMIIDKNIFKECAKANNSPYDLAHFQDFNSLLPTTHKLGKPIFDLTRTDNSNWKGSIWSRKKTSSKQQNSSEAPEMVGVQHQIETAKQIYTDMTNSILQMIDRDKTRYQQ